MRSSEAAMGGGARSPPVWHGSELEKTGARSARARTRGQNPLVFLELGYSMKKSAKSPRWPASSTSRGGMHSPNV